MYISRKSKGAQRVLFNEQVQKIPGLYNEKGNFQISQKDLEAYDILNLTSAGRVQSMDKHFDVIQSVFKQQLRAEQFDEFG